MRVYWPRECRGKGGIIVGWKNSANEYVVICEMDRIPVSPLVAVGYIERGDTRQNRRTLPLSVCFNRGDDIPQISPSATIVIYEPPNGKWMHYLSLKPIRIHSAPSKARCEAIPLEEHCIAPPANKYTAGIALETAIRQINQARHVASLLLDQRGLGVDGLTDRTGSPQPFTGQNQSIIPPHRILITAVTWMAQFLQKLLWALEVGPWRHLGCAQQLRLRTRRLAYVPQQWLGAKTGGRNEEYIRLYNSVWLAANDIILGLNVCHILTTHSVILSERIAAVLTAAGPRLTSAVVWLTASPAGLKLNAELARLFADIVIWTLMLWSHLVNVLLTPEVIKSVINFIAYAGILGVTMQLALASDALALVTAPLACFYVAGARIYRAQLLLLAALFRVFRGKKYNALRKRVDAGDFDLAQLLISTILFTIALFLLPTVWAFYAMFAAARITAVLALAVVEFALAVLNHFPLFPILLRLKSPGRVPGGLRFVRVSPQVLRLRSKPIAVSNLFQQYSVAASHLVAHYTSLAFLWGLLTGERLVGHRAELYGVLEGTIPGQLLTPTELQQALERGKI